MNDLPFKMLIETEIEQYRADTFWTKEPETIEWIKSFKDGDIFYDVGANVGVYSLYVASLYRESRIFAFEPFLPNYKRLTDNIDANDFENIQAFAFAISDMDGNDLFFCDRSEIGSSGGQITRPIDDHNKPFEPRMQFRVLTFTIDKIVEFIKTCPNHIKIDVDGQEERVLCGMLETIRNYDLQSILVELNQKTSLWEELERYLILNNFTADNRFNAMADHSRIRRQREGITAENVIFTRNR